MKYIGFSNSIRVLALTIENNEDNVINIKGVNSNIVMDFSKDKDICIINIIDPTNSREFVSSKYNEMLIINGREYNLRAYRNGDIKRILMDN